MNTALRHLVSVAILASLVSFTIAGWGDEQRDYFKDGSVALAEGRYQDAIDQLEAYADRRASHPDASFNRGLAYVARVQAGKEQPGDLGRAAAAFEETLLMRADDADARHALTLVHAEVARRLSRKGKEAQLVRPSLDRIVVGLASETAWAVGAVCCSFLLAVGLVLRRLKGTATLAGTLMVPAFLIGLVILTPMWVWSRHLRLTTKPAVVVVNEARLTDENGAVTGGEPIVEAARLEIHERQGRMVKVRYGEREGWLPSTSIRPLRAR